MIQAVVFDLDGVLIDTEQVWEEVRRGYVAELGREFLPHTQQAMMGMSTGEWSTHLSADVGVPRTPEVVAREVEGRVGMVLRIGPGGGAGGPSVAWPKLASSAAMRSSTPVATRASSSACSTRS